MDTIRSARSKKQYRPDLKTHAGEHRALPAHRPELKIHAGEHPAFDGAGVFAELEPAAPDRVEALEVNARALWALFPNDWPPCPGCGLPALEGQSTCGYVGCKAVR